MRYTVPLVVLLMAAIFVEHPSASTLSSEVGVASSFDVGDLAESSGDLCRTAEVSRSEQIAIQQEIAELLAQGAETFAVGGNIEVAWHVIRDGSTGNIPQSQIDDTIAALNNAFSGGQGGVNTGYTFTLASVDRTNKRQWFLMDAGSRQEQQAKRALATDVAHRLNIYSCAPPSGANWATFPWYYPENHYMHGIVLHYGYLPGGHLAPLNTGDIAVHEVGHYLSLYHTFQNGCESPGDEVDDTPYEAVPVGCCPCPDGRDSCPSEGVDPIHNYMAATSDVCKTEFTPGQDDRMDTLVPLYRPSLLDAAFASGAPVIAADSDPDGQARSGDEALESDANGSLSTEPDIGRPEAVTFGPAGSGDWADATGGPLGDTGHAFGTPATSRLLGAVPNPFREATTVRYELSAGAPVTLQVFDIHGRLVRRLVSAQREIAGRHEARWDGRDGSGMEAPAGLYFYRLEAGALEDTRRLLLLR